MDGQDSLCGCQLGVDKQGPQIYWNQGGLPVVAVDEIGDPIQSPGSGACGSARKGAARCVPQKKRQMLRAEPIWSLFVILNRFLCSYFSQNDRGAAGSLPETRSGTGWRGV